MAIITPTSFPGTLILPPPEASEERGISSLAGGGKMRDPGNEVVITRKQNFICSKTHLDGTKHEQTIIRRQLFASMVMWLALTQRNEKKYIEW